ncbi:hypothetical protein T484DRAFT_1850239 [Baffinella frigidus]|nr:hypothetical protein T484DRAFT_1850239 [Cryptophyta sp. CCMP2293]
MFKKIRRGLGGGGKDEEGSETRDSPRRGAGDDPSKEKPDKSPIRRDRAHSLGSSMHVPKRAFKYTYDVHKETWRSQECVVMIAKKSFQEGGMRRCHKMYEVDKHGNHSPGVAKLFKDDVSESEEELMKAYFDEAMTQTVPTPLHVEPENFA